MKTIKTLSLIGALMCSTAFGLQAEPPVRTATPAAVKPMQLSPAATQTMNTWKTTKNMQLLNTGNFVPLKYKVPAGSVQAPGQTGANTNFAAGEINCAKIPCPPVFGSDVTCWECQ